MLFGCLFSLVLGCFFCCFVLLWVGCLLSEVYGCMFCGFYYVGMVGWRVFVPSCFFWVLLCVGWFVYGCFSLLVKRYTPVICVL